MLSKEISPQSYLVGFEKSRIFGFQFKMLCLTKFMFRCVIPQPLDENWWFLVSMSGKVIWTSSQKNIGTFLPKSWDICQQTEKLGTHSYPFHEDLTCSSIAKIFLENWETIKYLVKIWSLDPGLTINCFSLTFWNKHCWKQTFEAYKKPRDFWKQSVPVWTCLSQLKWNYWCTFQCVPSTGVEAFRGKKDLIHIW